MVRQFRRHCSQFLEHSGDATPSLKQLFSSHGKSSMQISSATLGTNISSPETHVGGENEHKQRRSVGRSMSSRFEVSSWSYGSLA
ncbi:hypothetical protein NL676_023255 [Syzygium grande]|nr:hypothetical protein NL676_023255 [Syzygium grande]